MNGFRQQQFIQAEQVVAAQLSFGNPLSTNQVGATKHLPSFPPQNPAVSQLRMPRFRSVSSTGTVADSRRAPPVQNSGVQSGITVPRYQSSSQSQQLQVRTARGEQSIPLPIPMSTRAEPITVLFESTSFSIQDEGLPDGVGTALRAATSSGTSSATPSSYSTEPQLVATSQPELSSSSSTLPTLSSSSSASFFTSLATPKASPDMSVDGACPPSLIKTKNTHFPGSYPVIHKSTTASHLA